MIYAVGTVHYVVAQVFLGLRRCVKLKIAKEQDRKYVKIADGSMIYQEQHVDIVVLATNLKEEDRKNQEDHENQDHEHHKDYSFNIHGFFTKSREYY